MVGFWEGQGSPGRDPDPIKVGGGDSSLFFICWDAWIFQNLNSQEADYSTQRVHW